MSEKTEAILGALYAADGCLRTSEIADATDDEPKRCGAMLSYLKKNGLVALGEEGWSITDVGRARHDGVAPSEAASTSAPSRPPKKAPSSGKVAPKPQKHSDANRAATPSPSVLAATDGERILLLYLAGANERVRALEADESAAIFELFRRPFWRMNHP